MDEGTSDSADRYIFLGGSMPDLRQVEVSNDLYIIVDDGYLDLRSRQFDAADVPGVIIDEAELDQLIAKLTELKEELEERCKNGDIQN